MTRKKKKDYSNKLKWKEWELDFYHFQMISIKK